MKRIYILMLVIATFAACSKKEEAPAAPAPANTPTQNSNPGNTNNAPSLTINSPIQFWGEVDGKITQFVSGQNSYQAGCIVNESNGTDSVSTSYDAGILNPTANFTGIAVVRGSVRYPKGNVAPEPLFHSLFAPKQYPFELNTTEVHFYDATGQVWSTAAGTQAGSTFQVTDYQSVGTPTAPAVKAVMKFSCKVYKVGNVANSKEIKNAIMVGQFIAKK